MFNIGLRVPMWMFKAFLTALASTQVAFVPFSGYFPEPEEFLTDWHFLASPETCDVFLSTSYLCLRYLCKISLTPRNLYYAN